MNWKGRGSLPGQWVQSLTTVTLQLSLPCNGLVLILRKVVPHEILEDIVTQGSSGLVLWDNETEYVKEMPVDDVASFIDTRKESAGDLRTIGDHRDGSGKRYIDFKDGLNLLRETTFDDWPFVGPRAVKEYLSAIRDVWRCHCT